MGRNKKEARGISEFPPVMDLGFSCIYVEMVVGRGGTGGRGAVTNPKEGVGGGAGRKVRVKAALLPCSSSFNSLKIGSNHLRQPGRSG